MAERSLNGDRVGHLGQKQIGVWLLETRSILQTSINLQKSLSRRAAAHGWYSQDVP